MAGRLSTVTDLQGGIPPAQDMNNFICLLDPGEKKFCKTMMNFQTVHTVWNLTKIAKQFCSQDKNYGKTWWLLLMTLKLSSANDKLHQYPIPDYWRSSLVFHVLGSLFLPQLDLRWSGDSKKLLAFPTKTFLIKSESTCHWPILSLFSVFPLTPIIWLHSLCQSNVGKWSKGPMLGPVTGFCIQSCTRS